LNYHFSWIDDNLRESVWSQWGAYVWIGLWRVLIFTGFIVNSTLRVICSSVILFYYSITIVMGPGQALAEAFTVVKFSILAKRYHPYCSLSHFNVHLYLDKRNYYYLALLAMSTITCTWVFANQEISNSVHFRGDRFESVHIHLPLFCYDDHWPLSAAFSLRFKHWWLALVSHLFRASILHQ